MKVLTTSVISILIAPLIACAAPTLFPPQALQGVTTQQPEFGVLEAQPDVYKGRAVQLAGRIIEVQEVEGGSLILAREMPVDTTPAYGPKETHVPRDIQAPTGRFAFLYPGKIDSLGQTKGNKFIVVGVMEGAKLVTFDGISVPNLYLRARCVHIWKTGKYYEISDFPNVADGYYALPEETYCAK
jgi:starvation-inducible outer membrane lipoprotein